jgi:hypothetical protein
VVLQSVAVQSLVITSVTVGVIISKLLLLLLLFLLDDIIDC